ncbi:small, acid-soluble spore protein, alpha/beta type [Bacillus xiapuensis]|uniref:small, acid-soluble spore protein, alpha/beta type n=1 Tax=Bacillus xiapuensis TaxID=2014075 RepID=UPI002E1B6FEC
MTTLTIEQILDQLKQETALEMGIELGAETSSRMNGAVGGRVTQKLIEIGKQTLLEQSINAVKIPQYMYNQGNPPSYEQQLH